MLLGFCFVSWQKRGKGRADRIIIQSLFIGCGTSCPFGICPTVSESAGKVVVDLTEFLSSL